MTAPLGESQPPAPSPVPFSLPPPLSLSLSLSLLYLIIIIIVIITLELRGKHLGHFNQLRSHLVKGQDGLCEKEAAGREAYTQSHMSEYGHACAHGTHTTYQALKADDREVIDGHNFPLMPQNKEQGQIPQERPKDPIHAKPCDEQKALLSGQNIAQGASEQSSRGQVLEASSL